MRIKLPSVPSSVFATALVIACSVINSPEDVVTEAAGGSSAGKGGSTSGGKGGSSGKGGNVASAGDTGAAGDAAGGSPAGGTDGAGGSDPTGGAAGDGPIAGAGGGSGCVREVLYQANFTSASPVQVGGTLNNTADSFDLSEDNLSCFGSFATCNGWSQQDRAANGATKVILRFEFTMGEAANSFTVNYNATSDNGVELALNGAGMSLYANDVQVGVYTAFGGSHDATAINYAEIIYEGAEISATVASGNYASEGGDVDGTIMADLPLDDYPAFSNIDVSAFHEDNVHPLYIDDLTLTEEVCD